MRLRSARYRRAEATRRREDGRLPGCGGGNRRVGDWKAEGRERPAQVGGNSQGRVWASRPRLDVGGGSLRGRLTVPAPSTALRGDPRPGLLRASAPGPGAGLGAGQGHLARRRAPRRSSGRGAAALGFLPGAGPLPSLAPPARPVSRASRCWPRPWPRRFASLVPRGPATPPTCCTPSANRYPANRYPANGWPSAGPARPRPAPHPLHRRVGSARTRHSPDPPPAARGTWLGAAPPRPRSSPLPPPCCPSRPCSTRPGPPGGCHHSLPLLGGSDPHPALGAPRLRVGKTEGRMCVCSCFNARLQSDVLA